MMKLLIPFLISMGFAFGQTTSICGPTAPHCAVLTWGVPSPLPSGSITYAVYRLTGTCPAQPATVAAATTAGFTQIATGFTNLTYTDTAVAPGATYCYFSVDESGGVAATQSNPSDVVQAVIPNQNASPASLVLQGVQ